MDRIILKNGQNLEFSKAESLNITFTDRTIEELESIFTKENCSKVQFTTERGEVYGIYNNLECTSIVKNLNYGTVMVNLKELDDTVIRVEALECAVGDLGTVINELGEVVNNG